MNKDAQSEAMIDKWLEYTNLWADHDRAEVYSDLDPNKPIFERDYVLDYRRISMKFGGDDTTVVMLYLALNDELNNATLLGVFEDDELIHLTAEVDTGWGEVGHSEFPSGFINQDNPWKRSWKWANTP